MLLTSDSAFLFHIAELETAGPAEPAAGVRRRRRPPVGSRGRRLQTDVRAALPQPGVHWSKDVRMDKIAEGFGCHGEYVEKEDEIGLAIARAYASGKVGGARASTQRPTEEMPKHDRFRRGMQKAPSKTARPRDRQRKDTAMREYLKFYIDGQWVDPIEPASLDVDNPTTEVVSGKIALAPARRRPAVKAARKAFGTGRSPPATNASSCCRRSWPNTRSGPVIWRMRSTRRWAHRPRWRPVRRSPSGWGI